MSASAIAIAARLDDVETLVLVFIPSFDTQQHFVLKSQQIRVWQIYKLIFFVALAPTLHPS